MPRKLMGCPGWLKLSEDRTSFVFLADRAETVRKIYEASISGLGEYTIAKQFNTKGVLPFGPSPKWDPSTIHNILRNRATIGEFQPRKLRNGKRIPEGDPILNFYPPVIEESVFLAAEKARKINLASGRGRKGRNLTNLFRGIPSCAYCGSPVKFKSKSNVKSLICTKVIDGLGCYRLAWSYQDFEKSFLEFVKAHNNDSPVEQNDRDSFKELAEYVEALSVSDVFDRRMALAVTLKDVVSELTIASAGLAPTSGKPHGRIRLDHPGRYFELRLRGGSAHQGFPAEK